MTADRLRQLAAEAGFEQIMKHKDGSTTVLPDALFERFAALVLTNAAQAPAEGDAEAGMGDWKMGDWQQYAKPGETAQACIERHRNEQDGLLSLLAQVRAAHPQPKGTQELIEELAVANKLLAERQRVLDAVPPCPDHGPCVPHALEWIEKAKTALQAPAPGDQT